MNTDQIFEEMCRRDLTSSLRHFSSQWLGKSQNFATINRGRDLPADVLVRLRKQLIAAGHHDLAARVLMTLLAEVPRARDTIFQRGPDSRHHQHRC